MKKTLLFTLIFCMGYGLLMAQPNTQYSRLKVRLGGEHSLTALGALGLETDHGQVAPERYIINDYSDREMALLDEHGFIYEVLIPDVQEWYVEQKAAGNSLIFRNGCGDETLTYDYDTPENYEFGSMGGYFTYQEMLDILDDMAEQYPNLITVRQPIGDILTHEGRPIYWLKVSDNPNVDEEDEPEVLYTALHHAREPNSLSQMIFYLWYLLENYEEDDEISFLVNNTAMYFIPCINPDGYIHNETTNPNGGGLWRKNRWTSEDDGITYGVDLNRNYGFEWGADNNGSSPDPNSQVFRGPGPFSEPETQAVKFFCEQHEFQIAQNYHTFGNLLIHPWGYNDEPTDEDALFKGMGAIMTGENNFTIGTGSETVGYVVNGNSDDWMYGETETKPAIYSMTPEVGPGFFGFWPPATDIDELNKSAMQLNLATANLVHNYAQVTSQESSSITTLNGTGTLDIQKFGLADGSITIAVKAGSSNVTVEPNVVEYQLAILETATHDYNYVITPGQENAIEEIKFVISIDNGAYVRTDTLTRSYINGVPEVILADELENAEGWTTAGSWDITTSDFVSAPTSMTDSPNGSYQNGTENFISLKMPFNLAEGERAILNFWAKWAIEEGWDYAQVMISTDGGLSYVPLCGQYTNPGVGGFQPEGDPIYDGEQNEWVYEEIDISEYIGEEELYIRFYLASDNFVTDDGFYFDDVSITVLSEPIVNVDEARAALLSLEVQPNPFSSYLTTDFALQHNAGRVSAQLTSPMGQVLTQTEMSDITAGYNNRIQLNTEDLPAGIYLLRLLVDGELMTTRKVVKAE
jgi:carboxypeptidase T